MAMYPTRGIELLVPCLAETKITGWRWGMNFSRRGHDYAVRLYASGWDITRDGAAVRRWDDLPAPVQAIIRKQKEAMA